MQNSPFLPTTNRAGYFFQALFGGVFYLCSICCCISNAAIPAAERVVLVALYASTNGDGWTRNSNWNGPIGTECSWQGITCVGDNVVTISLVDNNLTGTLPPLSGLVALQEVGFSVNNLHGAIPSLSGLSSLQSFAASLNQLSGPIPSLTGLVSLRSFVVVGNQLSGSIPSLSGLNELAFAFFDSNQLTGSIPSLIGLTKLQVFSAAENRLSGSLPPLTGLSDLAYFIVNANQISGSIPSFTGLTSLQFFDADRNLLSGTIPQLAGMVSLEALYLSDNSLTGNIPSLVGLSKLTQIRVGKNHLRGSIPRPPSPTSSLYANTSQLCPNRLTPNPDAAWDVASDTVPWYSACINQVQSIVFLANPGPVSFKPAGTISVSATASSELLVTYSSQTPSICTMSGSSVILISAGDCIVAANQTGDANFAAAPTVTQVVNITRAEQLISFATAPVIRIGATANVSASGALPNSGNAITFRSATPTVCSVLGKTVTAIAAGVCTITANQMGSVSYLDAREIRLSFVIEALPVPALKLGSFLLLLLALVFSGAGLMPVTRHR